MDALLLAAIAAFYVFDVALLMYADEAVVWRTGGGWRASVGSGFTLAGRHPALPALLTPGAPVFRMEMDAPTPPDGRSVEERNIEPMLAVLRPLRWPARLAAVVLFIVVPAALLVNVAPLGMLVLLGLLYASAILAMAYVARHRRVLGLSLRDVAAIAFDVIACPPFSINLVRRVTLRGTPALPARSLATMLDADSRAPLEREIAKRQSESAMTTHDAARDSHAPQVEDQT